MTKKRPGFVKLFVLASSFALAGRVQAACAQGDPLQKGDALLKESSGGKVALTFEERTRWEERSGNSFGKDKDQQDMLSRLRVGAVYQPVKWIMLAGTGQDARAPFYGHGAPASMRDSMDLQEAYLVLGSEKHGFGFSGGRRMLNYGETRVIGVPQWSNTSRTYDYSRFEYTSKRMTLDALMVSPVIVLPDSFNNPELGNRYWGTYDVFPKLWRGLSVDAYALRHSQNKVGGWKSAGTLGTNTFGLRAYGPLPSHFAYSLEAIGQNGHSGALDQRAYAWFAGASRQMKLGVVPVESSIEYKGASGSHYGADHSATFDQLTPANHDKFGHMDLFGWRNLKTFKVLETAQIDKRVALNVMYTNESLFSASDALYNSSGSKISTSAKGLAGTRVGQEVDSFLTLKVRQHTFYAGFGHFFKGEFVNNTTPGINPRYFYIAQQYNIK